MTAVLRLVPVDPAHDMVLATGLRALQQAAYRVEADLIGDDRIPALHETVSDVQAEPVTWLTARLGEPGELVGAIAWTTSADGWDIDRLVVDPGYARQGIGSALVRAVLERAAGAQVTVSTGRGNEPACSLFVAHGFRPAGDIEVIPTLWVSQFVRPAA